MIIGLLFAAAVAAQESENNEAYAADRTPRSECGLHCLMACFTLSGRSVEYEQVLGVVGKVDEIEGTSLLQLRDAAERLGLSTEAVRWTDKIPAGIEAPAILPVTLKEGRRHFVTLVRSRNDVALVLDYPYPHSWMKVSELRDRYHWDGTALYIAASDDDLAAVRSQTGFRWRYVVAGASAGIAVFALSFLRRRRSSRRQPAIVEGSVA